jgi:hypothetical protein
VLPNIAVKAWSGGENAVHVDGGAVIFAGGGGGIAGADRGGAGATTGDAGATAGGATAGADTGAGVGAHAALRSARTIERIVGASV